VVGSTLVGLGRLWPGSAPTGSRGVGARLLVVALNVLALGLFMFAAEKVADVQWERDRANGFYDSSWTEDLGVMNRGEQVCNISAYDADGQPLVGVQLFDQAGRPLDVRCYDQQARKVPWVLGDVTRWNVFPLGVRDRPARNAERRADLSDASFPTPDRATTPAVTNPLIPVPEETERPPTDKQKNEKKKDGDRDTGDVSRR
jgi:hypothetical protein